MASASAPGVPKHSLKTIILPAPQSQASSGSTCDYDIVLMAHPRTQVPTRYLRPTTSNPQGSLTIYEMTQISGEHTPNTPGGKPRPRADELAAGHARSLLHVTPATSASVETITQNGVTTAEDAVVQEHARVVVCTPVDPLYFALGILSDQRAQFWPLDHLHDLWSESEKYCGKGSGCTVLGFEAFRDAVVPVCEGPDGVDLDGEGKEGDGSSVFVRLSMEKLVRRVAATVTRITDAGLPPAMHRALVVDALSAPSSTSSFTSTTTSTTSTTTSTISTTTSTTSTTTSTIEPSIPADILSAATTRAALNLVFTYIPSSLSTLLLAHPLFSTLLPPIANFGALEAYERDLKKQKTEAAAHQTMLATQQQTLANRKRGASAMGSLGGSDVGAEKKKQTRGERVLAKVDKSGMKKLTSFFKPAEKKA